MKTRKIYNVNKDQYTNSSNLKLQEDADVTLKFRFKLPP